MIIIIIIGVKLLKYYSMSKPLNHVNTMVYQVPGSSTNGAIQNIGLSEDTPMVIGMSVL